ncbi:MAG: hypothetical protein BGO81_11095 [Devosia sp. 66-22]|nr:MAG: hypothetical protein BGO81_11095 [Devosia sp. 66-22]
MIALLHLRWPRGVLTLAPILLAKAFAALNAGALSAALVGSAPKCCRLFSLFALHAHAPAIAATVSALRYISSWVT